MVGFPMMFYYVSYSQVTIKAERPLGQPGSVGDVGLQHHYSFTPITQAELLSKSFFTNNNTPTIFRAGFEMPGYYQPGEMMSTTTMYASIGSLKFHCNYYFDADGQLQDGEISICKKK